MLFHSFVSQDERRKAGGGDFIEFQRCRCDTDATLGEIVSAGTVEHWKADSLYVHGDDWNLFIQYYGEIFVDGFYNNTLRGPVDGCGINYYPPEAVDEIIRQINASKPDGYTVLLEWLQKADDCNGIYILGL